MSKAYCVKVTREDGSVLVCNMNDLDIGHYQVTHDREDADRTATMMQETFAFNRYEVVEFEF